MTLQQCPLTGTVKIIAGCVYAVVDLVLGMRFGSLIVSVSSSSQR